MGVEKEAPSVAERLEAVETIAGFAADQLEARVNQRDRLDIRTSLVVTSSGGLITVVGVLVAVLPKQDANYRYPAIFILGSMIAIALLLVAVVAAQVSMLRAGRGALSSGLVEVADAIADASVAGVTSTLQRITATNEKVAKEFGEVNDKRRRWLKWAGVFQLLGVLCLGVVVIVVLAERL
jgi:hypothetical protein